MQEVRICNDITAGRGNPLLVIAGPCVIESEEMCREIAATLKELCSKLRLPFVFKASFDKANRTSLESFRGPGIERGLEILDSVRKEIAVPVLTDIHLPDQAARAAAHVDVLQIPAFLCRQTDLILAAAKTGLPVNVKKGQFMAPDDMAALLEKGARSGNDRFMLCERGSSFGYNNLVVDMRSIPRMKSLGCPVIFDASHSTQKPGALGSCSGGERELARPLARAAVAAGADGVFIETHPSPEKALSDAATMIPLKDMPQILGELAAIASVCRNL